MLTILPGSLVDLGGIDQAIAAHPHHVIRLRQFGDHVAALIVGHDDLAHPGRQVGGLGDHPHAGFRPVRSRTTPPMSVAPILTAGAPCCALTASARRRGRAQRRSPPRPDTSLLSSYLLLHSLQVTLKTPNATAWGAAAGRLNQLPHPWHISEPFAKATEAIEKISFFSELASVRSFQPRRHDHSCVLPSATQTSGASRPCSHAGRRAGPGSHDRAILRTWVRLGRHRSCLSFRRVQQKLPHPRLRQRFVPVRSRQFRRSSCGVQVRKRSFDCLD